MRNRLTVSGLIFANEVLTAKIKDRNSHFLAQKCFEKGFRLKEIAIVDDVKSEMKAAVLRLCSTSDIVITSGGIGPTHDDMTYEAIAEAFQLPLTYHEPTLKRMQQYLQRHHNQMTEARKKMALFPSHPKLVTVHHYPDLALQQSDNQKNPLVWTPIVQIDKVYILPGVQILFTSLLSKLFETLNHNVPLKNISIKMGTKIKEGDLGDYLTQCSLLFENVRIGSYPQWPSKGTPYAAILTFDGDDEEEIQKCIKKVSEKIPLEKIVEE